MFDSIDRADALPDTGGFSNWRTVGSLMASETPQAIGCITKTWTWLHAEVELFSFEVAEGTRRTELVLGRNVAIPTLPARSSFSLLAERQLMFDPGADGSWMRRRQMSVALGAPMTNIYNHWSTVNDAPRLLMRAPSGDFSFGASARVHRSVLGPGAAGAAWNCSIWGKERSIPVSDIILPGWIHSLRNYRDQALKTAFIIVCEDESQLDWRAVTALDQIRMAFEAAFRAATSNLGSANTSL